MVTVFQRSPVSNSNTSENLERIQVPLKLSWGITIHKSQGLTIPNAVIDIGLKRKCCRVSLCSNI